MKSVELGFGCGKYGSLGKTITMIELNKVFAEVCFFPLTLSEFSALWTAFDWVGC